MMLKETNYLLPDALLLAQKGSVADIKYLVWVPSEDMIVLGQSNQLSQSVFADRIAHDNIRVMKRPTGGESVFLSPQMLILSLCRTGNDLPASAAVFSGMNFLMQKALAALGVEGIENDGISDLTIQHRKIAGSALYRGTDFLFYHAVLNVAEDPERIAYYLQSPQRQPDYRNRRNHAEFVTSLAKEGYHISAREIRKELNKLCFDYACLEII
jgi:lipoate-protein ligase A